MFHYSLHISIFFITSLSVYIIAANMFAVFFVITETSDSESKEKSWQTFRIKKIYSPQQRYNKDNLRTNYLMFNYLMFNYLMSERNHISLNWKLILNNILNLTQYSKLFKFLKRFKFDAHLNVFFLAQLQAQLLFSSIVTCQLSLHPSNNYVYNKKRNEYN